jgi:hypothetical protein
MKRAALFCAIVIVLISGAFLAFVFLGSPPAATSPSPSVSISSAPSVDPVFNPATPAPEVGKVFAFGCVERVGGIEFDVRNPITVIKAIQIAWPKGGADLRRVQVSRRQEKKEYNFADSEKGDFFLRDGDRISIPRKSPTAAP